MPGIGQQLFVDPPAVCEPSDVAATCPTRPPAVANHGQRPRTVAAVTSENSGQFDRNRLRSTIPNPRDGQQEVSQRVVHRWTGWHNRRLI
jgi:hypothetical protein